MGDGDGLVGLSGDRGRSLDGQTPGGISPVGGSTGAWRGEPAGGGARGRELHEAGRLRARVPG